MKGQNFGCEIVNDLEKPEVSLINQSESIQIVDRPRAKHRFKYGTLVWISVISNTTLDELSFDRAR